MNGGGCFNLQSILNLIITRILQGRKKLTRYFQEGLHVQDVLVNLVKDPCGFDVIILKEPQGASAKVYLYGGQVMSWKSRNGDDLLFVSSKATFMPPKTIRGGIQICLPQFTNLRSLENTSLAMCRMWALDPNPSSPPPSETNTFVDLLFKPSNNDSKIWSHFFEIRLRVALGVTSLKLTTKISNIDTKPMSFTLCLRAHFSVFDIGDVRVEGLETLDYIDNLKGKKRFLEQGDALTFEEEIDRTYVNTSTNVVVIDHAKRRSFVVRKVGLPDVAIWNPWDNKSKRIMDLGDEDYERMLCVECGILETPITLKAGEEWSGEEEIIEVSSSFCSGQLETHAMLNA